MIRVYQLYLHPKVSSLPSICITLADWDPGGRASAAISQAQGTSNSHVDISYQPPKGTRDFYPDDHRLKSWLFGLWRGVAKSYGFEEYDAPVVENMDLFIRKAGEDVAQQLYDFEDKSGRRLALRPEMTPSLARMVIAQRHTLSFPLKWFAIPQCWRYEHMTRGRRREHYQWNMDVLGVAEVTAEAELLSALITAMQQMGLTAADVGIKINSRKLLNDLMRSVGIEEGHWVATCVLIDKLDKLPLTALSKDIEQIGVDMAKIVQLTELLKMQGLEAYAERLGESEGVSDLRQLLALLEAYGVKDFVEFDPTVVRGLAYYTGIVFEGFDRSRTLRAICGGGRYDKLLESFGSSAVPAVGFGFGDAVIVELLKMKNLLPDVSAPTDVVAYAMSEALRGKMLSVVQGLRRAGVSVDTILDERKPKWVFQKASRMQAKHVVLLGEDEDAAGEVTVKDLRTTQQQCIPYDQVAAYLTKNS